MKTLSEFLRQEIMDSRDIIERVEILKSDCLGLKQDIRNALKRGEILHTKHLKFIKEHIEDEISLLSKFRLECEEYTSEFQYGETIIGYHYFEEYCQECANDWGYLSHHDSDFSNPLYNFIDWKEWAEYLKHDYAEITCEGNNYYIRCT